MPSQVNRREFLKMAGLAAATATLAACGEQPSPATEGQRLANHRRIDTLKVYPLLPPARFNEHRAAMSQSSSPLLRHLATGLAALWQGPRPPIIPSWVSPVITPLVVTTDNNLLSRCVAETRFGYDYIAKVITPDSRQPKDWPSLDPVKLGLHLGIPDRTQKENSPAIEAFYLLKEYITMVSLLPLARTFYRDYLQERGYQYLSYETGQPITDPNVIEMINVGMILNNIKDGQKSLLWRLYDGLPTAILSQHLHHHLGRDISSSTRSLFPFVAAGQILAKPGHQLALTKITDLANQWVSSANLSPPDSYLMVMLDDKVVQAIEEIQETILPRQQANRVWSTAISVVGQSPPFALLPQLLSQPV
jgi:hypothetical protein